VSWAISAVRLPDDDGPVEVWVDDAGRLVDRVVPGAEPLPGRYVICGLVDAHAHPSVTHGGTGPVGLDETATSGVLAQWSSAGVVLVRDVGSPGGLTLRIEPSSELPTVLAAGRFLAPEGRYFPALLPEPTPPEMLIETALAELARGAQWVKVIADFPTLADGVPAGAVEQTYPHEILTGMIEAVHATGGRVAVHATTDNVTNLVRAGADSIEHGTAMDESTLELMATRGAAWVPTLNAAFAMPGELSNEARRWQAEFRDRLRDLLPCAVRLGVPVLAGTDTVGTLVDEIVHLAEHGLQPVEALAAASTTAFRFLNHPDTPADEPATLVTYPADPRQDLSVLAAPSAVVINGRRIR
jgi:imidazolonepropionase-like amidohydrolase